MQTKKVNNTFFVPKNNYEQLAMQIYFLLVDNFSKTFFVGGMVRNLLLKKKITDIDIATSANPDEVINLLSKHKFKLDLSGKLFGVIKIKSEVGDIEIATLRTEQYNDSRYPQVKFVSSVLQDSKRRDFSVNSLYFQAKTNIIYDPQNGLKNVNQKQIRIIGNPKIKLEQDPLRIIRAYRFSKQFNLKLEPKTELALQKYFHLIHKLSQTKLQNEINKSSNLKTKNFLLQLIKKS